MICPAITGWSYEMKWPCDCTYSYAPRCQNDQKWPVFAFFIATFTLLDQIQNEEMSFASGIEHSILPPFKYLFIHSFINPFIIHSFFSFAHFFKHSFHFNSIIKLFHSTTHYLRYSLIHSFYNSFICSLIHSFIYSFINSSNSIISLDAIHPLIEARQKRSFTSFFCERIF